ncbi:MAG: energy transducer TonB [Chitinophagaceae bacterium]
MNENKSGTCRLRFIVDKDGSVSDVKVLSMQGTKLAEVVDKCY